MDFPALKEAQGKLNAARKSLADVFAEAGPTMDLAQVKSIDGDNTNKVGWIRTKNEEIEALAHEVEGLEQVQKAARNASQYEAPAPQAEVKEREFKSLGDSFTQSLAFKGRSGPVGPAAHLDIEMKALFETGGGGGAGWTPETTRTGRVVDLATRPIQVTDVVPLGSTAQQAVVYMEETTFTNAATEIAEAGTFPQAALALTERSSSVRKIAVYLPVTDEQLEDEAGARAYVNNRLPFMLRQRLDSQILVGDGTAPNLKGFLNVSGIQTQAKGADPTPDAIYKAMTKVRVTGRATPGAVMIHSTDWQGIRLLRTADGVYIWGNPSESGIERLWGLPVVVNEVITQGTALVGDFQNYTELAVRRGIDVQVSNSHSTYFIEGKQAIRADMRAALVVYRPAALCTVTGL
ncbi:phage major capsid protein [Streptomyces sp. NPDC101227]|uniref:phage major capsid protein n=1 Tax=Streptomyces sp. NPDC101227 TaxID=3366136 RepID=UPI0037FAF4A7